MRLIAVKEGGENEKWRNENIWPAKLEQSRNTNQNHTQTTPLAIKSHLLYTHSDASLNSAIIYDTCMFTQLSVPLYICILQWILTELIRILSRSYYSPKSEEIYEKLYFV